MKGTVSQKYILKIHSSRLRKSKWNLILPLNEARDNDEIISLADSQVLRWIDQLNGISDLEGKVRSIRAEIRHLQKEPDSIRTRRRIKELYSELDNLQYKPDYMCLIIDKIKDYTRACKGFSINGIKYRRLLGTNGGIKNSTIVFVSERLYPELNKRIENGRDPNKPLVTAKLEAYRSLTCSASTPVSLPHGILVVPDCETTFLSDTLYITDEDGGDPVITPQYDQEVTINASDGCGMIHPTLARRWSEELGLDYVLSGINTRFSFEKGCVFTFDYIDFAEKIADCNYIVKDAWGNDVDVRDVELILTTSMVKLWDSYESCDQYISTSLENDYSFAITKVAPAELESERCLNYQYIQSYDLDDSDIDELMKPTVDEINDVLGGDWRKTLVFLCGSTLSDKNVEKIAPNIAKAIMACPEMVNDPHVKKTVYSAIKNRINEAKTGGLKVHGNYSIASGDLYALCQNMWGFEVTGLLKAGEIYNAYWRDNCCGDLVCFRSPMTHHGNIRRVSPNRTEEAAYWFRYIKTCTIFNAWDTCMGALNGMDFDGDLVMLTDNEVLLNKHKPQPALICVQRRADKKISTEEDFIQSNINSFGNEIGQTTNWVTSMFEVQAMYPKDSDEYKELAYRIMAGQHYQQNAIDKAKGIICNPMPKEWRDYHSVNKIDNEQTRKFYKSIVVDKKPYFMRYIYPNLMKKYNTYIKNVNKNCLREFQITLDELCSTPYIQLTGDQIRFLGNYKYYMPVGTNDCVMNKICTKIEHIFDKFISETDKNTCFDYHIMRSSSTYNDFQFYEIRRIFQKYTRRLRDFKVFASRERIGEWDSAAELIRINDDFVRTCIEICPDPEVLCNIVLDICYNRSNTKKFAWEISGSAIVTNLIKNNNGGMYFPVLSPEISNEGFYYSGRWYTLHFKQFQDMGVGI